MIPVDFCIVYWIINQTSRSKMANKCFTERKKENRLQQATCEKETRINKMESEKQMAKEKLKTNFGGSQEV